MDIDRISYSHSHTRAKGKLFVYDGTFLANDTKEHLIQLETLRKIK